MMGIRTFRSEEGELLFTLPFGDSVMGRPGFLQGGAIAGLLELAAIGTLGEILGADVAVKPINVTVNFMRGGIGHETFASATVSRIGNRVANVEARAWQQDRSRPIAGAQMNLLLRRGSAQQES